MATTKVRPVYTCPVVIVGNGGSVDRVPPSFWRQADVAYLGTNRALALAACQTVDWSALFMRDRYSKMFRLGNGDDPNYGWQYHRDLWKPATAWKVGDAHDRVVHCDEYTRQVAGWQAERTEDHNGEAAVMRNASVVLMAANWAWIQGARDIRLIGVDYRPPLHGKLIEPWASYPHGSAGQYDRPVPHGVARQFAEATAAIYRGAGTIVNYSPGTALREVPAARYVEP